MTTYSKYSKLGAEGGTLSNTSFSLVLQAFVDFPKNSRLFLFRTDRTDSPWRSQLYLGCSQDLRTNELNFENLDYVVGLVCPSYATSSARSSISYSRSFRYNVRAEIPSTRPRLSSR